MQSLLSVFGTGLFLLFSCILCGQSLLVPGDEQPIVALDRFELLTDSSFSIKFPEVFTASGFEKVQARTLQLPEGATYWIRFSLRHGKPTSQKTYLRLVTSDFYSTQLFIFKSGESARSPLKLQQRNASFPIDVPPRQTVTGYLYLDRRYLPVTCQLQLMTSEGLALTDSRLGFTGGLYTGVGLLYLLLALFTVALLRNPESWYFLLYVTGGIFYLFYSRAEPLPHFFADMGLSHVYDTLPYASVALSTFGYIGLFYNYFKLAGRPVVWRLVRGIQASCAFLLLALLAWPWWVEWWFGSYLFLVKGVAFFSLAGPLVILLAGVRLAWRERQPDQIFFLFTFLPMLVLVTYIWLAEAQVLPRKAVIYDNGPGLLVFYEAAVLGAMLVYRYFRERLRLLATLKNERREIIHDLHSGLLPEVDMLRELNNQAIRPLSRDVHARLSDLSGEISEDLRLLMWTLNREQGEDLDELVGRLREKVGIRFTDLPVRTVFVTKPTIIPENIAVPFTLSYHLVHFVKEVLNNVAKHAKCGTLTCHLILKRQRLELTITDDGCGFKYGPEREQTGFGLAELSQRAEKMGGVFTCNSEHGLGTVVGLSVPLAHT